MKSIVKIPFYIFIIFIFSLSFSKANNPLDTNWRDFVYDKEDLGLGSIKKILIDNNTFFISSLNPIRYFEYNDTFDITIYNYISELKNSLWVPLGIGDSVGVKGGYFTIINDMIKIDSFLYVGGIFDTAGCVISKNIAVWNTNSRTWSSVCNGVNGIIISFATNGQDLFVGGGFDTVGTDLNAKFIAKWNGSNWDTLGPGFNGEVNDIYFKNDHLYVVGDFDSVGTLPANHFAIWDINSSTWSSLGRNGPIGDVLSICKIDSNLYLGGVFEKVISGNDTISCHNVIVWDGTNWDSLQSGTDGIIFDMINYNSDLVVVGDFIKAGNDTVNNIARWDGNSWKGFGSGADGSINTIAMKGDSLLVGGTFNFTGDILAEYIGLWYVTPPPLQLFNPIPRNEHIDKSISLKVYPNPTNGKTTFEFNIDCKSIVKMSIFDLFGNELIVLVNKEFDKGNHKINWDATSFLSGIYICKISSNNKTITNKLILSK